MAAWAQTPLWPFSLLALLVFLGRPVSELIEGMAALRVPIAKPGKLRLRERPGLAQGHVASLE